MLSHYLFVGLGGAVGAISRVLLGSYLPVSFYNIPIPILCVNILGCFLMGLLTELMTYHLSISENMKYFLISGFLGGFTTFSAFTLDFALLFEKNLYIHSFLYTILSFSLTIIAFFVGLKIVKIVV